MLKDLLENAQKANASNSKLLDKIRKKKPKKLDVIASEIHDEVFDNIDCLSCANCCKTLGPLLTQQDIERISKKLKLKEKQFIANYLILDEDNDYVFKTMPCVFLETDNHCSIYKDRPKACREYPHTNHKKLYQIKNEMLLNAETCPAVLPILEKIKEKLGY